LLQDGEKEREMKVGDIYGKDTGGENNTEGQNITEKKTGIN